MRNLSPLGARFSKPSQGFGPTGTLQRPGLRSHAGAWDRSDSTASNDFVWCARRTLPLHAEFATAGDAGWRFGLCRNDLMIGGSGTAAVAGWRRCPVGAGWPVERTRMVAPGGRSFPVNSAPFITRFPPPGAVRLFDGKGPAGRGGRPPAPRNSRSAPVVISRQPTIPWKNTGPVFTMAAVPMP